MSLNLRLGLSEFSLRMSKPFTPTIYEFDDFRLDAGHLMLYRGDEPLPLAPKAVETLLALIERRGEIISKDELIQRIWPDAYVEESNLFLYLSVIRKALGKQKDGKTYLETLRRRGYRFRGDVRIVHRDVDEHLAWVTDSEDGDRTNIETQSGRVYVLKDWNRDHRARREKTVSSTSNMLALNSTERPDPQDGGSVLSDDSASLSHKQQLSSQSAKPKSGKRKGNLLAAAAVALVLFAGVSAVFFYRAAFSKGESSNAKRDLSITTLTKGEDVQAPTISPDGKLFAYCLVDEGITRLMLQRVGQLNAIEILKTESIGITTFSPDGDYIYFSAKETNQPAISLYRIPAFGGQPPRKILTDIREDSPISFSPDGSEFAFVRIKPNSNEHSIVISPAGGGPEREILVTGSEWLSHPAWSRDGKTIAFVRTFAHQNPRKRYVAIEAVSLDDGVARRLVNEKLANCYRVAWTSGDKGLVFGGTKLGDDMTGRRDQVWFVNLSEQDPVRLSPEGIRYYFGGLTNDDAAMVGTVDRTSQIWVMDSSGDSRTAKQLTRGSTDGRTGIAPLPDGRVAYTTRNGDNWEIWTMNADGSGASLLFDGNPTLDEIRATPDGKYIVFIAMSDGNIQLFRIDTDGGGLKQLTFGDAIIGDSSPSADGSSVVYNRTEHLADNSDSLSLYRISIDGGEQTRVEGAPSGLSPHYSPDGRYISLINPNQLPLTLKVMSVDGSDKVRSFEMPGSSVFNVGAVWTPDGRSLAYAVYQERAANVWLQPLDGGSLRQLTDFTSGRIHRVAYSSDGKHIYLARGYAANNALLIKGFVD